MTSSEAKASDAARQIGRLVSQHRAELKITQSDLADAIAMGRTTVTNIERGHQGYSVEALCRIAGVLGAAFVSDVAVVMAHAHADLRALLGEQEAERKRQALLAKREEAARQLAAIDKEMETL